VAENGFVLCIISTSSRGNTGISIRHRCNATFLWQAMSNGVISHKSSCSIMVMQQMMLTVNKCIASMMTMTRLKHKCFFSYLYIHVESKSVQTRWHQRLRHALIRAHSAINGFRIGLCHILKHQMQRTMIVVHLVRHTSITTDWIQISHRNKYDPQWRVQRGMRGMHSPPAYSNFLPVKNTASH